jgi:hypothetical protein
MSKESFNVESSDLELSNWTRVIKMEIKPNCKKKMSEWMKIVNI